MLVPGRGYTAPGPTPPGVVGLFEGAALLIVALLAFLLFGVGLVLPGVSQPAVAAALDLDLVESGLLASGLSLGLGIGVVLAGPAVDRLPRRPLFCAAAVFAAAGVMLLPNLGGYTAVLAAVFVLGLGGGVFETVLNTAIPESDPERAASRLALVHASATAGAALGAGVLGASIGAFGWRTAWLGLGVAYLLLAAVAAGVRMPRPPLRPHASNPAPRLWPAIFPLVLASAAYVGLETALTIFLPPFVVEAALEPARGALAISAFWGGLLASRLFVAVLARGTDGRWLLVCGVAGGILLALTPAMQAQPEIWAGGIGFALGPVFPLLVALTGERFAHARGTATGIVVGAGSLGGVVLPWVAGMVGEGIGVMGAMTALSVVALSVGIGARR